MIKMIKDKFMLPDQEIEKLKKLLDELAEKEINTLDSGKETLNKSQKSV
jgi:hypothetical protein